MNIRRAWEEGTNREGLWLPRGEGVDAEDGLGEDLDLICRQTLRRGECVG